MTLAAIKSDVNNFNMSMDISNMIFHMCKKCLSDKFGY